MSEYDPRPLMYRPQREGYTPDLAGIADTWRRGQLDQQAKQQAEQAIAQRDRELAMHERSGNRADTRAEHQTANDERHANSRDALYAQEEERRNREVVLDRKRLMQADHEKLLHQLFYAATPEEAQYAAAELKRNGYEATPMHGDSTTPARTQPSAVPTPEAPPDDPTLGGTPLPPDQNGSMGRSPMRPPAPRRPGEDAALSNELDSIDQTYSKGLGVAPKLPGSYSPLRARAVASDQLLSADDPYNKIVR